MGRLPRAESVALVIVRQHLTVDDVRQMALEAANRLPPALALGAAALEVGLSPGVDPGLDKRDRVERPIQPTVAAPVEPMTLFAAGMGAVPFAAANQGDPAPIQRRRSAKGAVEIDAQRLRHSR